MDNLVVLNNEKVSKENDEFFQKNRNLDLATAERNQKLVPFLFSPLTKQAFLQTKYSS